MSAETLYLIKVASDRPKCSPGTPTVARFRNSSRGSPGAAIDRDFTLSPVVAGKVAEIRNALEAQFLNVLKAAMARRPDLIKPSSDRAKMVFDAVAAGAPEEIIELTKRLPEETSDLAANALKSADPRRHFAWIRSRVSSKSPSPSTPSADDSGKRRRLEMATKIIERARNDGTTSAIDAETLALYGTEQSLSEILGVPLSSKRVC